MFFIAGFLNSFARLESVVDLGYIDITPPKQRITFRLIYDNDRPAYILFPGSNKTHPCYVPLKTMAKLRTYLNEVVKVAEGWTKEALDSAVLIDKRQIELKGPQVWMFWNGMHEYNKDEIYEGWDAISAEWEFHIDENQKPRSYITLSANVFIPYDEDEFRNYEMKLPLNVLKEVLKGFLSKKHVDLTINSIEQQKISNMAGFQFIQR